MQLGAQFLFSSRGSLREMIMRVLPMRKIEQIIRLISALRPWLFIYELAKIQVKQDLVFDWIALKKKIELFLPVYFFLRGKNGYIYILRYTCIYCIYLKSPQVCKFFFFFVSIFV